MAFFSKSLRNWTKKHDFIEGLTEWSPTEYSELTEFITEYSPTDFTDTHRSLGCVLPPNLCTSVQSVGVFVGGYPSKKYLCASVKSVGGS